jgi:hypothetical protein
MVGSDSVSSVTQGATPSGVAQAGSFGVTPSAAVIGTGNAGNYTFSYAAGTHSVNPAPLSLTAVTNTKSFDGNASAQALPLVAGLMGSDTVTNLSEAYADSNLGNGKTLMVQTGYVIADGNGGGNYMVSLVGDATGVIRALPVAVLPPVIPPAATPNAAPAITVSPTDLGTVSPATIPPNASGNSSLGVTVSAINPATQEAQGLVVVVLPAGTSTSGTGLNIPLPESMFASTQPAGAPERVTLPNLQPLPSWIRYDAVSKTLILGAVPRGVLPIMVWVTLGDQTTVVQVSESDAQL